MLLFEGASQSLDVGNLCPSVKVLGGGTYLLGSVWAMRASCLGGDS